MRPGAPILHPGPVMIGVELSEAMTRHPRSLILRQVAYGVAVRQAALVWALGLDNP
jgi:aspartate carbamoyltransferase catalytic subunit